MRAIIIESLLAVAAVFAVVSCAQSAEPTCVTKDAIMARVQRDISAEAVGALMNPEKTADFALASGFPYPDAVGAFLVVATPGIVGVFALNVDGCAVTQDGVAAATTDDPMVMIVAPDTLRRLMAPAGDVI